MKKILVFIVFIVLLTGCGGGSSSSNAIAIDYIAGDYITGVDGQNVTISFDDNTRSAGTISSDNGIYRFSYETDGTFNIIYPDGYVHTHRNAQGAMLDWTGEKSPEELGYINAIFLAEAVNEAVMNPIGINNANARTKEVPLIASLLIIAVGIWQTCSPKSMWWLSKGWLYKNAEPSDMALIMYGFGGVVIVFVGIMSLFS